MKILLFGKGGQVGWELQRSLSLLGEVVALDFDSTGLCGDFTNLQGIANSVALVSPALIVNAAAYTAVDKAEKEPELAHTINALAPAALADAANTCGATLIHYSTDYVFDGSGSRPWVECDAPAPLNVYGTTKLAGDNAVATSCHKHLILRTSWVYSARGSNFARTMLKLAVERKELTVIDDQYGAPTGAELLADATAHAVRQLLADDDGYGLYHLAADGVTTWHDYAVHVLAFAARSGQVLQVTPGAVRSTSTSAYSTPATRPLNSRLDTTKFQRVFGLSPPPWQAGVERMLLEIL